jgi:hypothetical protein
MTSKEKDVKSEFLATVEYVYFFLNTDWEGGHAILLTLPEVQNAGLANSITTSQYSFMHVHCIALLNATKFDSLAWRSFTDILYLSDNQIS